MIHRKIRVPNPLYLNAIRDTLFLFFGDLGNTVFRIKCSRSQLDAILKGNSDEFRGSFLVVFTITNFTKPLLSVDSEVVDYDEGQPINSAVLTEADATIVSGDLVKITAMP
jgi:hypothetical protein